MTNESRIPIVKHNIMKYSYDNYFSSLLCELCTFAERISKESYVFHHRYEEFRHIDRSKLKSDVLIKYYDFIKQNSNNFYSNWENFINRKPPQFDYSFGGLI